MFGVAIRGDSVSLLRFPYLNHVLVFLWEISLFFSLEIFIRLFFFPFLFSANFSSVDVYVVCIVSACCNQSFSALFIKSSSRFTDASTLSWMLVSPLFPFFLDTYSPSMSFLGCKAYCIVMSFLVLWSICWSSSLVHFKNSLEYLTNGTAQEFIHLIRYFTCCLVSSSLLVLLRYLFLFLFYLHMFDVVYFQYSQIV